MDNNFLSTFTPSLMSANTLEAIFVQRQKLVEDLIESVCNSVETANKHFRLLIGMRGIGKTHTIALIYHRLKKREDLQDKLLIAWLKEEEWGVSSWLDLLIRIFHSLAIEYPQSYETKLQEKIESLYQLSTEDATYQAERILQDFIGDKTLLLLTENLDEIFKGLGDIGQKQFRAYLQNNNLITIIATSQSLFAGVSKKESPFYCFFNTKPLDKLTIEEATELLRNIAQLQQDKELELFIASSIGKDRIKAIHHLAGGNHRVYVIFSQFLTRNSLDELVKPVMKTLDELTPYYQARMKWLSPQQRKIIELLCEKSEALPVKEIAQRCFISHQTASSQLKDLRQKSYVTHESIGRESFYELQEPLMRICLEVKKQRGEPIKLFIDFLRIWYTKQELRERLLQLPENCLERDYINHALEVQKNLVRETIDKESIAVEELVIQGIEQGEAGNLEAALELFEEAIKNNDYDHQAWYNRGVALDELGRLEEAIASFDKALEIKPDLHQAWHNRGNALFNLGKLEEAISSWDKALELKPDDHQAWYNLGITLHNLRRFEEAISSYNKALELKLDKDEAWYNRGITLGKLGRFEEAIASYNKAISLNQNYSLPWFNRIKVMFKFNNWEDGFKQLDEALNRFVNIKKYYTGDTREYINFIWDSTRDIDVWKSRIETLVNIYDKHQVVSNLSKGIVDHIPTLMSEIVSDKLARTWLEIWQSIVGDKPELSIALRFLKIAVQYKESKGDRRVLMKLAKEEREILEPLVMGGVRSQESGVRSQESGVRRN